MRTLLLFIAFSTVINSSQAMDINKVVRKTLSHNPQIQQFYALEQAAAARKSKAQAPFWPTIETDYAYWTGEQDSQFEDDETSVAAAIARYNLFNGRSDYFRLREASYLASSAVYQRQSIVADIVLAVKGAYIEVLRSRSNVETEEKSVELLERQKFESALRLREGLIARNDLLRVEVELSTAQQRLLRAIGDQANARERLRRIIGSNQMDLEHIQDLAARPLLPTRSFEAMQKEMFFARSELRFLHNRLAADRAAQQAVSGEYLPKVDLVFSYERFGNGTLPEPSDQDYDSDSRAMLEASWVLFSGFDTHYEIKARAKEIDARYQEIRATEDLLTQQLKIALEELQVAEGNLLTAETGLAQAEENYRVNANRYKAQVATTVDLLDAQEFLTRARNEKVKAFYDFHLADVALERILQQGPKLAD